MNEFLEKYCVKHPSAVMPMNAFWRRYREFSPGVTRTGMVADLTKAGFAVGRLGPVDFVGGLALAGKWAEKDGELTYI